MSTPADTDPGERLGWRPGTAIVVSLSLGSLCLLGQRSGFYGPGVTFTLLVVANVSVFGSALYAAARALSRSDERRREAQHALASRRLDVEERARENARLSDFCSAVSAALTECRNLEQALGLCANAMVEHLGAAVSRIWTVNDDGTMLELRASAGLASESTALRRAIPIGQLKTLAGDPHLSDPEWVKREDLIGLAHPLTIDERVVGVMEMFGRQPLSPETVVALAMVATELALSIERERTERALRANEERTRLALEAAGIGVWEQDFVTNRSIWSDSLRSIAGMSAESDMTFERFVALVHPDDRAIVEQAHRQAIERGDAAQLEYRLVRPDGSVRWMGERARVIRDGAGVPQRRIGINMDITERKQLETQFQQAQKMEALGQLAGGVAHDFNNLLTAILGYVGLLKERSTPGGADYEDLKEVEKAGSRACGLTGQLLAFSRRQILQPRVLDLNAVVQDATRLLQRLIGEHIGVTTRLDPDLASVLADPGQLLQVLVNLAVNARDAMANGGTLSIETANVELTRQHGRHGDVPAGSYVMIAVTDTGVGMDDATQARLFEPFFTTKGAGQGTGLGLATVYGIVKQSGGFISMYSEPGTGTCFKIYLPPVKRTAVASVPEHEVATNVARSTATGSVLLVEDEVSVRRLARIVLERQGYHVLEASGPAAALEIASQETEPIRLLLTDMVMPGASGPELHAHLVRTRPDLKVLFVSGYTDHAIFRHGVLSADVAFLQKPFTPTTLLAKVRDVLRDS